MFWFQASSLITDIAEALSMGFLPNLKICFLLCDNKHLNNTLVIVGLKVLKVIKIIFFLR